MAAAAAPRSMWTVDAAAGPTPAINGVGGTSSGRRRPGLNLFSVPVCGAMFGSFALCIIVICVHSFFARRRARRRFIRRTRDMPLSGWSADVRPPPPAATAPRLGVPPPPTILPVYVPPAPPSAPDRGAPGANSNSNSCRSTVNPTFISDSSANSTCDSSLIGDCPVCLEPLRVGCGDVMAAHACGHVFHSHCIQPWLHQRGSCPVCRCTLNSTFNSDSTSTSIPIVTSTSTSNSSSISNSTSTSNFPSTTISNTNSTSTSNSGPVDECPLCLEPLHVGGGAMSVHVCGHTFHSRCIEWWWLHSHRGSCPMCSCTVRLCIRDPRNEVTSAAASGGARSRHPQETVVVW